MSTQRRAAALLDGRHDFELTQAQMRALSLAPSGPMHTEDVGDFQGEAPHAADLRGWQNLQRADHRAQDLGGYVRIHRSGLELFVSEQNLDHADIDLLLQ